MAEGALFVLVGDVSNMLGSLIALEVKLAFGVKTDFEYLKDIVFKIQAVILDAEWQSSRCHQIEDWLSKLKDVLHDADDLLNDLSTQVLRQKVMSGNKMKKEVRLFFSSSNQLYFGVKMGHELKAIRKRLNAIAKDMEDFHFIQRLVEPQVMNWGRETYSFVLDDEVIGREDDKKGIMKRLFDDNVQENISIIPIVGIGGLGKTTLAQLVYNDENVKRNFEPKLWVCISDISDVKRIVKEILELTKMEHEESLESLQKKLREKLDGKKYLIVLDDLWNEDSNKWLPLRNLLTVGARGSRVIVTTRSVQVARIIGATSWHALEGLPKEKAWSLFVKMAFEQGQLPENQAFVSLGKEIVDKCGGVPLAIRTIASLLSTIPTELEWCCFKVDELSKITQEAENGILSTLKLCYDHLPARLKQCFAYCRLFPKDYKIDVNTLINLWIAQGFIVLEGPRQRFVDIGRKYFMELLRGSFFQDVENDYLGSIESCKMHDLMHDLAIFVSRTESAILSSSGENVMEKVHHVSFDMVVSSSQFSIPVANKRKIRTILAASVGGRLGNLTCDALISNLNYLRTLDLSCFGLHEVPHSIGELSHLRYLDLSNNKHIVVLPNSITNLLNLLTLKLNGCRSLKELPRGLKMLVNLRHLDVGGCDELTHMPLGLGHLTSLERLTNFVVRQGGSKASSYSWYKKKQAESGGELSELKELSNLGGSLVIENLGHGEDDMVECKATNMKQKKHLQVLQLMWEPYGDDGETECYDEMSLEGLQPHPNLKALKLENYMGVRIPSWVSSLTNLVHFELNKNRRLRHLPPLSQLPFLKSVDISTMGALEYISVDTVFGSPESTFFSSLSSLRICFCPNLKGWWRTDDVDLPTFSTLYELEIRRCPNLTSMPKFPNLKEKLILDKTSSKVLQQTLCMEVAHTQFPLSSLESLELWHVNDLESLPEGWLQNLVSLRALFIYKCDGLRPLPFRSFQLLTSLRSMEIWDCNEFSLLNGEDDGMQWQGLSRLHSLDFEGIPKLVSLPNGLQHVTTLQILKIFNCPNLIALPEWIGKLTSLEVLQIWKCPKVTSLPLGIGHLSSLSTLYISNIPNLMALPVWICNLTSLKTLHIENLPNLTSLPQEISNLTSLYNLTICDCANLASLPPGIRALGSSQNLSVRGCPLLSQTNED